MPMQIERLDLHGFTVDEAMSKFVRQYNRVHTQGPGHALKVIHGIGKGSEGGAIKETLRIYLKEHGTPLSDWDMKLALLGDPGPLSRCRGLAYAPGERIRVDIEGQPDVRGKAGCTVVIPLLRLCGPYRW